MSRTAAEQFFPNGAMPLPRKDLRAMVAEVWKQIEATLAQDGKLSATSTPIAVFNQPFEKPDGTKIDAEIMWFTDIPTLRTVSRGRTRVVLQAVASPLDHKIKMLMDSTRINLLTLQMEPGDMRRAVGEDAYDILSHEFTHLLEPRKHFPEYQVESFIREPAFAIWDDYIAHAKRSGVPHGHTYSKLTKRFTSKRGGETQVRIDVEVHQPQPGGPQWPVGAVLSVQAVQNQRGEPVLFIILDGRYILLRKPVEELKDGFLSQLIGKMQDVVYKNWAPEGRKVPGAKSTSRWWKLYHNDPWEVRAFLQELWLELRTMTFQRMLDKLVRDGASNAQIVEEIIAASATLQENWQNLTPENKRPFLREMSDMIERARLRIALAEKRLGRGESRRVT